MRRPGIMAILALFVVESLHSFAAATRNSAFIGYHEAEGGTKIKDQTRKSTDFKVKISSPFGEFIIKLRPDLAPDTCLLVWELAQKASCPSCKFYRHEPVPMNWGQDGFYGPPYALLQGSLADLARQPPFENAQQLQVKKGYVCIIPNCKEFFIATADHPEWGSSHTIFGEVEDMSAEPSYPFEPFHTATNSDKITTRWLDNSYAFNLTAIEPVPSAAAAAAQTLTTAQAQQQTLSTAHALTTQTLSTTQALTAQTTSTTTTTTTTSSSSSLSSSLESSDGGEGIIGGISPGVLLDRMEV